MNRIMKIGIVEDDETLSRELAYFIGIHGYETWRAEPGHYGAEEILASGCHLLLLDIGLPDADGIWLCREIRRQSDLPVIMITSQNTEMTELMSMNSGADDFVAKPFHPQILLARIEAILKRAYRTGSGDKPVLLGQFSLDTAKGRVTSDIGSVELTKNELKMMTVLAGKKGQIVSRDEIMNALWDDKMFVDDNTLTVNMTRLKNKLESIGIENAIVTKRGMGYQLL